MPKRVIDFDAMWGSDKLASCAAWAQAEYAWLYGLADACGCFELTNLRVIWGRVAAIRGNLTIERLEQVFIEFQDKGLLFTWEHEGKRYGHWTGSDVPGRLPAPSWRMRLERFAPPVPKAQLAEYMARFARGRAAMAGGGFRTEEPATAETGRLPDRGNATQEMIVEPRRSGQSAAAHGVARQTTDARLLVNTGADSGIGEFSNSRVVTDCGARPADSRREGPECAAAAAAAGGARSDAKTENRGNCGGGEIKPGLEEAQEQDLNWNRNLNGNLNRNLKGDWEARPERGRNGPGQFRPAAGNADRNQEQNPSTDFDSNSNSNSKAKTLFSENANSNAACPETRGSNTRELLARTPGDSGKSHPQQLRAAERSQRPAYPAAPGWGAPPGWYDRYVARQMEVERELRVGTGPVLTPEACGGVEALERWRERARARDAALRGLRKANG